MMKLKDLLPKINEGPQRDMNVLADYIIDLNIELSNAKILAKKHPKYKKYIKFIQQDIKDANSKLEKIKKKFRSMKQNENVIPGKVYTAKERPPFKTVSEVNDNDKIQVPGIGMYTYGSLKDKVMRMSKDLAKWSKKGDWKKGGKNTIRAYAEMWDAIRNYEDKF